MMLKLPVKKMLTKKRGQIFTPNTILVRKFPLNRASCGLSAKTLDYLYPLHTLYL